METDSPRKRMLSSIGFVALIEMVFGLGCIQLQGPIISLVEAEAENGLMGAFIYDAVYYFTFLIPLAIVVAFMFVAKRESLRVFGGGKSKSMRSLLIGLLLGFAVNAVIALVAGASGAVSFTFNGFSPFVLLIIPFAFIQCTGEEVLDRGMVPAFLEERHSWAVVALVSGALFSFGHFGNSLALGFNPVFHLNVLIIGAYLYLLTKLCGNFWVAAGFHTGWNYTQSYLFGLPNSGYSSPFGLFIGENAQTCFAYDAVFGNEGSLLTLIVNLVTLGVIIALLYRKRQRELAQED